MIELYLRLAQGCKTGNQLNALHIALERRMTPLEFTGLRSELRRRAWIAHNINRLRNLSKQAGRLLGAAVKTAKGEKPVEARTYKASVLTGIDKLSLAKVWMDDLHGKFAYAGKHAPEPFRRRRLRHSVWTFSSGLDRRQKILLICFSGNAQRLMMPTPVFLQHIDARGADIAYLRTESLTGYRQGIRGVADDLDASIAVLDGLLNVRDYGVVATMGTSGGALPAILAGLRLGADAVLSVAPNNPNEARWTELGNAKGLSELWRRCAVAGTKTPEVNLVYGGKSEKDAVAASVIASCIGVREIRIVPGAPHGALEPLVERGQFGDLLRSTVLRWPAAPSGAASMEAAETSST